MPTKNKPAMPIASTCDPEGCQGCPDCPEYTISTCKGPDCQGCENYYHGRPELVRWLNADGLVDHSVTGALPEIYAEYWAEHGPIPKPIPPQATALFNPKNTLNQQSGGQRLEYQTPKLPASMRCPFFGMEKYKVRRCAMGRIDFKPFACGKCPQCFEAWVWAKLTRYSEGVRRSNVQTLITVDGLADDSAAAEVRTYLGNRLRCTRFSIISRNPETYLWRCVVVTAEAISRRDYVLAEYHTALRYPTALIAFSNGMVSPDYLRQFLHAKNETPGGHKPTQFSQGWIAPISDDPAYQWSDGIVGCLPAGATPVKPAKHVCQGCRETQEKYPDVEGRAAHNAMAWLEGRRVEYQALADMVAGDTDAYRRLFPDRDYEGPKRLIADLVAALHHEPASISRHNPRGMVLRHDARLAMVLAYAHSFQAEVVAV